MMLTRLKLHGKHAVPPSGTLEDLRQVGQTTMSAPPAASLTVCRAAASLLQTECPHGRQAGATLDGGDSYSCMQIGHSGRVPLLASTHGFEPLCVCLRICESAITNCVGGLSAANAVACSATACWARRQLRHTCNSGPMCRPPGELDLGLGPRGSSSQCLASSFCGKRGPRMAHPMGAALLTSAAAVKSHPCARVKVTL